MNVKAEVDALLQQADAKFDRARELLKRKPLSSEQAKEALCLIGEANSMVGHDHDLLIESEK